MPPKHRTRFMQGPAIRQLKEHKVPIKIPVVVAKRSLDLGTVPPEIIQRVEVTSRYNIWSYFEGDRGNQSSLSQLRDRRVAKRQQQNVSGQFDMSPGKDGGRTRRDSPSLCSSSSSMVLVSGANQEAFNDSLDGGSQTVALMPEIGTSLSMMSDHDLQRVLRMWEIETRSRGSEVGASRLGRELQKLYPSEILPPSTGPADSEEDAFTNGSNVINHVGPTKSVATGDSPELHPHHHHHHLPVITSQFATLAKWQIGTNRPDAQLAHFQAINSITMREGSLIRLLSVVERLDEHYWKYSVARLKVSALRLPLHTIALIKLRKTLIAAQDECRVAIAHYRGTTVQVVGDVLKWKVCCQQESQTKDSVEILYNGVNYYEKMTHDVDALCGYTITRLWFNVLPNTFMVSPTPQSVFDYLSLQQLDEKITLFNAHLRGVCEKVDAIKRDRDRENFSTYDDCRIVPGLETPIENIDEEGSTNVEVGVQDDALQTILHIDEPNVAQALRDARGSLKTKSTSTAEWKILRDYCIKMWGLVKLPAAEQKSHDAPEFCEATENAILQDMNGMVVLCYLGFTEVYPKAPMVPLLPESLVDNCTRFAVAVKKELKLLENLRVKAKMGMQLRRQVEDDLVSEMNLLNQPDLQDPSAQHLILRQRQEAGGTAHRLGLTHSASDLFAMTSSQTHDSQPSRPLTNGFSRTGSNNSNSGAFPMSSSASAFESLFYTGEKANLSLPRLDAHKIQAQLEERVADQRQVVERQEALMSVREAVLAKKTPDPTKIAWRSKSAEQLQRIVRGMQGRRRFIAVNRARVLNRAAAVIQKYWRGIWGRVRFLKCMQEFRLKSLTSRKIITNKDDSALKITHFIRYLGESRIIGEDEAAAKSPLFMKKNPDRQVYKSLNRASPKRALRDAAASVAAGKPTGADADAPIDVIDRDMLSPYLWHYHDTANEIRDPSLSCKKERSLLSQLDTRLTSRLIPKSSESGIKPFSARGRVFAEQLSLGSVRAKSLSENPNSIYLVPPSLATESERILIEKALNKCRTKGKEEGRGNEEFDLRRLLRQ